MVNDNIFKLNREVKDVISLMKPAKRYVSDKELNSKTKRALSEIEKSHNTSWAVEMFRRNSDNLDLIALSYRGNKITYRDMFNMAYDYAKSLMAMGYKKGDEIPICVGNIPEFVYLMLASSFIGAEIVVVGDWFDSKYLENILNNTKSKYMFVSEDNYEYISSVIEKSNIEKIVMCSLNDSLPMSRDGKRYNPYQDIDDRFNHDFTNRVSKYKGLSQKMMLDVNEFLSLGKGYNGKVVSEVSIDDAFAKTFTSGTTDPGCPKCVIHSTRSYVTLSRWKESDVSGLPSMRNMTVLAHIPTYTHMELSCAISDTLYEKCTLALEPFYDRDFFIYSLLINKPNFVPASNGFWTKLCDLLNYDDKFKNINMPFLMLPTITGEECSIGEEYYYNLTSKRHKFGTDKLPYPLSPVTFSIGGGTSESSGVFVTILKSLQEKRLSNITKKYGLGLTPHSFVDLEVLDKDGSYCAIGKSGLLVIKGPCDMLGYSDEALNEKAYITDKYGKKWLNQGAFAYKTDTYGRVKMKGRPGNVIKLSTGSELPYYVIEDTIRSDVKNILVAVLLKVEDSYVCHVELQRECKMSKEAVIASVMNRLSNNIPLEVLENMYVKVRTSFPIAPSGKRDTSSLLEEGIDENCVLCSDYLRLNSKIKKRIKK